MKSLKSVILFVVLISWGAIATAQFERANVRSYSGEANKLWKSGAYAEAAEAYKLASEKIDPKNAKAKVKKSTYAYLSGTCYDLLSQHAAAEQQYEKAILLRYQEIDPSVYSKLAEMQMSQCKHDDAKENFEKYLKLDPSSEITKTRIASCEFYAESNKNPTKHLVTNVTKLNTSSYDYSPVMGPRGKAIYFSSSRSGSTGENSDPITGENYMDIWESKIDRNGNWGQPTPLAGAVNSPDNEGTMCFDSRGKLMFFSRCVVKENMNLGCDIYVSELKGKTWGEPKVLDLAANDTISEGHPACSPDGKVLIYASNQSGGFGGIDLYMTTYDKRADSWSLPVNLGPEINTAQDDVFPTWGEDGKLYYATDGLVGLGGLDIFVADRVGEENKWENPTNMGAPINSCRDDLHIIFTESGKAEAGYISSNRNGSKGDNSMDIYTFKKPPVMVDVMILVSDQEEGYPIEGAKVKLIGSGGSSYDLVTDASGQVNLGEKPDGTRFIEPGETWTLEVEGLERVYLGAKDNFTTADVETNTRIIRDLKTLNIQKPIKMPSIQYVFGTADLLVNEKTNSPDSLLYLYNIMADNPNLIVELIAHTDCRGSDAANKKLSQRRAETCVNYLVNQKGIAAARLIPKGLGESTPATHTEVTADGNTVDILLDCDMITSLKSSEPERFEKYHQENRRTECAIISFDYVPSPEPAPVAKRKN